ncbi:MAG: glycosyltransferase family 4 protein [Caldilineaceae bacterium]|nr:glycosyltransferase family 4 protein [Caldilineaceae bacterium]
MNRLIIGIDASRALTAQVTGTERYSLEIIRHLLRLPEAATHRWRLYTPIPAELSHFGIKPSVNVEIRVLPALRLWTHRALGWEVARHPPDVLFVPAHVIPLLPPPLLPPSVVTIHDLGYRHFPDAHTHSQRLYLDGSTRWSTLSAQRIIAVSHCTADDLMRFYGVDPAKISVVYEAAQESEEFLTQRRKDAETQRQDEGRMHHTQSPITKWALCAIPDPRSPVPNPQYALYLGTIQPRKNLARLIEAYARLVKNHAVEWDLVLAGKRGWLSEELYTAAQRQGIGDRVHFPGYIPAEDAPDLLRRAIFFAFPSLFEGFGLPVLEAQQKGVPVMCANNSALPEVAGDAAILVDPTDVDAIADAMLKLSQDETLRQELIAKGYENVKRFSWEKAARETLAVLEKARKK